MWWKVIRVFSELILAASLVLLCGISDMELTVKAVMTIIVLIILLIASAILLKISDENIESNKELQEPKYHL